MKKILFFTAFLLGFFLPGNAQIEEEIELSTVSITERNPNKHFLEIMKKDLTPSIALKLQEKAANFAIKEHLEYGNYSLFEVLFKSTNGNLRTYYDENGKIAAAVGKFSNVAMPRGLVLKVMDTNRGWKIIKNKYHTFYDENKRNNHWYLITLTDGNYEKQVKVVI